jgi:RNA polymerase sigma-70 factor (sigma-E family)
MCTPVDTVGLVCHRRKPVGKVRCSCQRRSVLDVWVVVSSRPGKSTVPLVVVPVQPGGTDASAVDLPAERAAGVVVVFEVHYAHLVLLARHLVDDPGEAEDVVMDAFAGLTRNWKRVRRTEDAFFYLRASVVNGSRSRLRRLRVARGSRHTQLDPDAAPAEQVAMIHLEHDAVVRALRTLPRRQREVLVLRYYDGATETEIAATLGIGVGSVKTHASRGLRAVADRLEGSP